MKTITKIMMTAVLLVVALTARAQHGETVTNPQTSYKMAYSISGGKVTSRGEPGPASNNRYVTTQRIVSTATSGTTIRGTIRRVEGPVYHDASKMGPVRISYIAYDKNNKRVSEDSRNDDQSTSISYTIQPGVTKVTIYMTYMIGGRDGKISCEAVWNVSGDPAPTEQEEEEKNCHQKDSKIRFNDYYGQVMIRCYDEEDDSFEFVDLDRWIYENDLIETREESGAILGLEDMSTYVIKPETRLIIRTEEVHISKWEMLKGCIIGNIKKMREGKAINIEMSHVAMGIKGTIFALEETGRESRVWLFAGSVDVKSKKTGKVTKLQPGQRSITGTNGVVQVKSFNIEEGAKKFGIKMSDINNHYSNPSTSTNNNSGLKTTNTRSPYARYGVKCGVVKRTTDTGQYKNESTTWWDDYGRIERTDFETREPGKGQWAGIAIVHEYSVITKDGKSRAYDLSLKKGADVDFQLVNYLDPSSRLMQEDNMRKSGTSKVSGKNCVVYKGRRSDGTNVEVHVWEGIPLKTIETKGRSRKVTTVDSMEFPSKMNASTFDKPKGIK